MNPAPALQNEQLQKMTEWMQDHSTRQSDSKKEVVTAVNSLNINMVMKTEFEQF